MKKAMLLSLLAGGILFAQEVVQFDRMENMRQMEKAMSEIQKGFLYNNLHVVQNGVKHLKTTATHTESFIKPGLSDKGINNLVYAKKQTESISSLASEIESAFKEGDKYSAANGYLMILSKCLSCHQTIRSW